MAQKKYDELRQGERGAIISILAYIFLAVVKLVVGTMANSAALRADGLNNATDIVASIAVLIGLRLSQKPPDEDHPYGHWKAETVASMIASFIMMVVGLQVLYEAATSLFSSTQQTPDLYSAWTGAFCALIMYAVYRYNRKLAKKINSQAVRAAAKDNLSDAWVSIGTVVGIVGSQFGLPWLDAVTAFVVGMLICKTAWDIFKDASHHLTDGFDEGQLSAFSETVITVHGVKAVKQIKARNYGNNTVVDIVVLVNPTLLIKDAHDIATKVEEALMKKHDVFDVHVHVEPK